MEGYGKVRTVQLQEEVRQQQSWAAERDTAENVDGRGGCRGEQSIGDQSREW
jgi:hypothetical protein